MRRFFLQREEDATGVSGTGRVADGVEFTNGWCVLTWKSEFSGVTVYPSISVLESVHTHGGQHKTILKWIDPKFEDLEEKSNQIEKEETEVIKKEITKELKKELTKTKKKPIKPKVTKEKKEDE